jgi:hypothetical protein
VQGIPYIKVKKLKGNPCSFLGSKYRYRVYEREVRELATLVELENRVKKLEERSSIQDEAIRRVSNFVQRVFDAHDERKGDFVKGDEDRQ